MTNDQLTICIYPPLSIGLGLVMVIMEGMYLRTCDKVIGTMTRFGAKISAKGIATGIAWYAAGIGLHGLGLQDVLGKSGNGRDELLRGWLENII